MNKNDISSARLNRALRELVKSGVILREKVKDSKTNRMVYKYSLPKSDGIVELTE
jgi:predicted transcriptional regulator